MFTLLRRTLPLIAVLLLSLTVAACGDDDGGEQENAPAPAEATPNLEGQITIGAVLPVTGPNATLGEDQLRGIDLAVEKVNSDGGVLGKELVVKTEDSEGSPQATQTAARKLVSVDHVPVIVGEYSSGNTIPMAKYLERQKVVLMNPGASSPEVADLGDWVFSTIGLDTIAGKFSANTLYDAGFRTASLLAPNNAYGKGVLTETRAEFERLGGKITSFILYTEGQSDYRAEVERLGEGDPEVYIYTAYGTEAATISRQAFELGIEPTKFFCMYTTLCTADAEPEAVDGQYGMDVNFIGPDGEPYAQAYEEKYGEEFATSFSGYTYDGVMLAAEAINEAGSTDATKIRDALTKVGQGYPGVTGEISFDADGQRESQPYLLTVMKDGKATETDAIPGPES